MPQYTVDEELALCVERLAKRKPFENLTFNEALRRVLEEEIQAQTITTGKTLGVFLAEEKVLHLKKASSPKPSDWLKGVPDLKGAGNFTSWKSICSFLNIDTAGDSARRRLKKWVEQNRVTWPEVPDV
ncbi:MAG: hypothetical protein V7717_07260 [Porticoccaceae bacterium]